MSKRVVLSFFVVVLALLVSSAAAPAAHLNEPAPLPQACYYQCKKCTATSVKLCSVCNGVVSCGPCQGGTVCDI
jgi:hypothetical protein